MFDGRAQFRRTDIRRRASRPQNERGAQRRVGGERHEDKKGEKVTGEKTHSRPEPRPRDRPQRDSSQHVKDDPRRAAVHDAVVVAQLGADEEPRRARRPDPRVRGRGGRRVAAAAVVGRAERGVQHGAVGHGRVVERRARAGLDELVVAVGGIPPGREIYVSYYMRIYAAGFGLGWTAPVTMISRGTGDRWRSECCVCARDRW